MLDCTSAATDDCAAATLWKSLIIKGMENLHAVPALLQKVMGKQNVNRDHFLCHPVSPIPTL